MFIINRKFLSYEMLAALTWFGFHCGAGFASGAQVKLYAIIYGKWGVAVPVIAWVLCSIWMYIVCEYSRLIKAESYKDVGMSIYGLKGKYSRGILILWDFLIFMSSITAIGSCVAGCGALFKQLFFLPYAAGCAGFVIFMIGILCFGKKVLTMLGRMGIPLIFIFLVMCIACLYAGINGMEINGLPISDNEVGLMVLQDNQHMPILSILKSAYTYAVVQIGSFQALCVFAGKFENKRQTKCFAVMGFVINCGAMLLAYAALMMFYPGIMGHMLPLLAVVQSFDGVPAMILMAAYDIVLLLAYVTTAGAMIVGAQARYLHVAKRIIGQEKGSRLFIAAVFLISASLMSGLGLNGILVKVNQVNALLRTPVWFLPILILGPLAIRRANK